MTLRNPPTEPQIPGAIARDSEVVALANVAFPRSAAVPFDFNNWSPGKALAGMWVDNAVVNPNAPPGNFGVLLQFDPFLFSGAAASSKDLYKVQVLIGNTGNLYKRAQFGGVWSAWS
jgi:hypothetical protein